MFEIILMLALIQTIFIKNKRLILVYLYLNEHSLLNISYTRIKEWFLRHTHSRINKTSFKFKAHTCLCTE